MVESARIRDFKFKSFFGFKGSQSQLHDWFVNQLTLKSAKTTTINEQETEHIWHEIHIT